MYAAENDRSSITRLQRCIAKLEGHQMDNPIISYIQQNLQCFTEESTRLSDIGVLQEYWSLAFHAEAIGPFAGLRVMATGPSKC